MTTHTRMLFTCLFMGCSLLFFPAQAQQKPKVWIYSDISDKTLPGKNSEHTINDPDDISALAGYLLMCNEFQTLGIVVTSTHRKEHATTPNQVAWANSVFGNAYKADLKQLKKHFKGYPAKISFQQSCIKESAEKYQAANTYQSLSKYSTVAALHQILKTDKDTIYVLCWGTLTEPAILVNHCLATGQAALLKKVKFIGHWTNSSLHQGTPEHPEHVANCREDGAACAYIKEQARQGTISYYELGAIGQHGIVSGQPKGEAYYQAFKTSQLGKLFAEGKFTFNGVDHSDAATYWVLLEKWGVRLSDVASDGTNNPETEKKNEAAFMEWSKRIHEELLRRAKLATP